MKLGHWFRPRARKRGSGNGDTARPKANGEATGAEAPNTGRGISFLSLAPAVIFLAGYSLLLALLLPGVKPPRPEVGLPSPVKIVAPWDIDIPDLEQTALLQQKAADSVIPVFNEEPDAWEETAERLDHYFRSARTVRNDPTLETQQRLVRLSQATGLSLDKHETTLQLLLEYAQYDLFENTLRRLLEPVIRNGVVATPQMKEQIERHSQEGIDIVDSQGEMARRVKVETILDQQGAIERLRQGMSQEFNKQAEDEKPRQLAAALAELLVEPTLEPNDKIWRARKQAAIARVAPRTVRIQQNQKLLDEGDIVPQNMTVNLSRGRQVTVSTRELLSRIFPDSGAADWTFAASRGLIVLFPLVLWWIYLERFHQEVCANASKLASLMGLVVLVVGIGRLLIFLNTELGSQVEYIGYALPVALAGMLATILLAPQLALITTVLLAYYSGLLFGQFQYVGVHLIAGMVSVFAVNRVRRRIDITWAGVKITLAICASALLMEAARVGGFQDFLTTHPWPNVLVWGFCHGIVSIMLAGLLQPVLETIMHVITDIQLLELSQRSRLLKRVEAEAPGTYQHSLNVANLAESAAESVGANGLLARVAALYHDIGKLSKPAYFAENQSREAERKSHDKLAPNMSRMLISKHVKDGVELAEKANLPKFIKDAVAQHHGTTLLTYFYDKALKEDSKDVVNESDFRYPGPKPQSKEMAILMLADSLEAATRTLQPGTPHGEVYQFVRKIINEKFVDGQFEECDLTLSDLHRLTESFTRSLVSILHRRIAYPAPPNEAQQRKNQAFMKTKESSQDAETENNNNVVVGAGVAEENSRPG